MHRGSAKCAKAIQSSIQRKSHLERNQLSPGVFHYSFYKFDLIQKWLSYIGCKISRIFKITEEEKNIAERIKESVREKDPSAKVILYGSRARGDFDTYSDWDILILVKKENVSLQLEQEYRHHLLDLELEIGEPISVTVHSEKKWESEHSITPLYKSIEEDGVVLH